MNRLAFASLAALFVSAVLAQSAFADPSVSVELNPMLPDHVENPNGVLAATCIVDTDGTVPEALRIAILDPDGAVVAEWVYPEATEWSLEWTVPAESADGLYTYLAEYYSFDGFTAAAEVSFLVAGRTSGICAFKFIDENGNGVPDDGEVYAEGWEICFSGPDGVVCEFTDEDGAACVFFLTPGVYEVCETMQEGYESTTGICTEVIVGNDIEKALFGNREATTPVEDSTWGRVKSIYR